MFKQAFVLLLVLLPGAVLGEVSITPFVGWASEGVDFDTGIVCVTEPCPSRGTSDHSMLLGAIVNGPLAGNWSWEGQLSLQPTEISFDTPEPVDLDQTRIQVGALRHWGDESIQPFVVGGVGLTRLDSDPVLVAGDLQSLDLTRFAASLGGGARLRLTDHTKLRLEARGYWTDLPANLGGSMTTIEATTGVSFTW